MAERRVLLIVGGGIAAYKALEMVRLFRKAGVAVRPVLTRGGAAFVTPLSLAALSGEKVHEDLFSLTDEAEMGHIELSRSADLVVVAPATADLMAKAAAGLADDLASALLLATDKTILMAPAMNVRMWTHPATVRNLDTLRAQGVQFVGPDDGEMACGEYGPGRLAEPQAVFDAAMALLAGEAARPLAGRRALVTAGPTVEPLDPVRLLTNRSSGRQGYAIAEALARLGAETVLVSGPTALSTPPGVQRVDVETADDMLRACEAVLPVDVAILTAAVADWRPEQAAATKLKKRLGEPQSLRLVETVDILARLAAPGPRRPRLVVGFAAETPQENGGLERQARAKRERKGCDWIVANDVGGASVMGGTENEVTVISGEGAMRWPRLPKTEVGRRLAQAVADALGGT